MNEQYTATLYMTVIIIFFNYTVQFSILSKLIIYIGLYNPQQR